MIVLTSLMPNLNPIKGITTEFLQTTLNRPPTDASRLNRNRFFSILNSLLRLSVDNSTKEPSIPPQLKCSLKEMLLRHSIFY